MTSRASGNAASNGCTEESLPPDDNLRATRERIALLSAIAAASDLFREQAHLSENKFCEELSRMKAELKSEHDRNIVLADTLATERNRAGVLADALATERDRTADLADALAAERDRTRILQSLAAAQRAKLEIIRRSLGHRLAGGLDRIVKRVSRLGWRVWRSIPFVASR